MSDSTDGLVQLDAIIAQYRAVARTFVSAPLAAGQRSFLTKPVCYRGSSACAQASRMASESSPYSRYRSGMSPHCPK